MLISHKNILAAAAGLALLAALPAHAASALVKPPQAMPPAAMNTQPIADTAPLRLTSNKNELVRLNEDAVSVIVNNPDHASVMLDSARLLIIAPRAPGTTSFTVLNAAGQVILQRDIIVSNANAAKKYVRVRRICSGQDATCVPAAYFYCPDGCYEVTPIAPTGSGTIPAPAASAVNAAANIGGADNSQGAAPPAPEQPAPGPLMPEPDTAPQQGSEPPSPEGSNQ